MAQLLVVVQLLLGACLASAYSNESFPAGFMFGAATAAYQIEGAWDEEGKGENIWDHYVHEDPTRIIGNATGDVACDSYHNYQKDVALVFGMGLSTYRFSLSWSRILPTGFINKKNTKGIQYYRNLITELTKNNITPIVTLYHWDLPQPIQDMGGWLNPKTIDYFVDYARVAFQTFGTVKYWLTFNEPKQVCSGGYGKASKAPGLNMSGQADYQCAYVLLKAHAAAYHLYKKELNMTGEVSLAIDGSWSEPATQNKTDIEAAERKRMFEFGLYANPVFIGDWPEVVKNRVGNRSKAENFTVSRLPIFTKEEITYINGTADFMAVNFYTSNLVSDDKEAPIDAPSFEKDLRVIDSLNPEWEINMSGHTVVPWTIRSFLKWLKDTYANPKIIITENGMSDDGSTLDDYNRIYYLAGYLDAVLEAIHKDKVRVHGYTLWSLLDNFEWLKGYSEHYGLYSVNFTDPLRVRKPKKSVDYYRKIVKTKKIPEVPTTTPRPSTTTQLPTPPKPSSTEAPSSGLKITSSNVLLSFAAVVFWTLKI